MQENKFRETVFLLWASRFIYNFEQLLEDGYDKTKVLKYFSSHVEDVCFIWRSSYADHKLKVLCNKKSSNKMIETLNSLRNLWSFILLLALSGLGSKALISTRKINPSEFTPTLKTTPKFFKIVSDNMVYNKSLKSTYQNHLWKKKFLYILRSKKYKITSAAQSFIEENIDEIFPKVFISVSEQSPRLFQKIKLINFGGDIFKSNTLFSLLWRYYYGEIFGAQHGGGYGIFKSRLFTSEMQCYQTFFIRKLEKSTQFAKPQIRLELIGDQGLILVGSMPFNSVEATKNTKTCDEINRITEKRMKLRHILKSLQMPVYIREHPKSKISSFSNTKFFDPNHPKPLIWARKNDLIILESPGTTTEIECIKYGLNYVCIFDLKDYPLTKVGISHYRNLILTSKLITLEEFVYFINKTKHTEF